MTALVVAEDRRSEMHRGVDPIAMIRAFSVRIRIGRIQGASTIEQQFVRVISGRYERSITRKLREQALAIAVARRRTKDQIAAAYLSVAFYGSGRVGTAAMVNQCGAELDAASQRVVFGMIARLKYAEPLRATWQWHAKLLRRIEYIEAPCS